MITLQLTRGKGNEEVYLKLPATPAELGEAFAELDSIASKGVPTRIVGMISNVYNLSDYIKNTAIEQPGVLDKLTELAQKLQTMDRHSCRKFEGVLDANSVNGIDDVLRLSESLDDYAVLPDAGTGSALGKYLVERGIGDFPERVRPYLDYQVIGAEFYANHGGAFCRAGYVVREDELPEQLLTQEQPDERFMSMRLRAKNGTYISISLPASEKELEQAKQDLGIDEFAEAEIVVIDYATPYLGTMIPYECITIRPSVAAIRLEHPDRTGAVRPQAGGGSAGAVLLRSPQHRPARLHQARRVRLLPLRLGCRRQGEKHGACRLQQRAPRCDAGTAPSDGMRQHARLDHPRR